MANENIVSGKKYKVLQNGVWKLFSFFTKAYDVEFDDGMNAEEKIQFIEKNGVGIKLTLADYERLSEEEKKSGTYWIEDANEPLGDGSRFLKTTDVVDSLDVADPTAPLSANMGRELMEELDNINSDLLEKSRIHLDYATDLTPYIATGQYVSLKSDGYIIVECPAGYTSQCYAQDAYSNHILAVARSNGTLNGFASVYVRKGMSIAIYGNGTSKFLPFIE